MILEIDNVELNYKKKSVLNGVYLKAETGSITGILGHNGCGKSCLLNIIFGSLEPKYKLIRIDNKPILEPLYLNNRIAFLSQHDFIPNRMKIATAFKLFRVNWDNFTSEFPLFEKYKLQRFHKLSGGERRIVEIYLVLNKTADIILLDEPFNGVAPLYIEKIKAFIHHQKYDKIVILTDHRYKEVTDVSDSIYLIKNGCTKLINKMNELEDYRYVNQF
ncbi:ABC transporter ATP-binding protein [Hanstruepera neustonica]|uniref:ABC transporter ATP-binding protein n=1 Tax=Hanstruepera neustonica TaxID=1445657 RepID=A0A2K1DZD2_9FLAO|nr:ABC transporter ATP-binding protein [Hanstruepera neustonica]PNQ73386.1 ABC transporter ATP-binding protein [Hanstruepera neustonica]